MRNRICEVMALDSVTASYDETSLYRRDCHDPPHAAGVGFHDDKSPPRRLVGVARSGPWRTTPAQVVFPGDATWRRRLPWVVESDLWCNNHGEDCLQRDRRGKDRHRGQEICALAALATAKVALRCAVRPLSEQHWRGLVESEEPAPGYLQLERRLVVQGICCSVTNDTATTATVLMGTSARTLDDLKKVVVGFLNGGRIKGYVYDFSPLEESFNLLPQEHPLHGEEIKVEMKDLKAVFFVWEFTSSPEDHESPHAGVPMGGRTIEVTFTDGEKIVGRAEGYSPQRIGFFMYPVNPKGNNIRIFVDTRNTRQVRLV